MRARAVLVVLVVGFVVALGPLRAEPPAAPAPVPTDEVRIRVIPGRSMAIYVDPGRVRVSHNRMSGEELIEIDLTPVPAAPAAPVP